jgi:hypothetical protein
LDFGPTVCVPHGNQAAQDIVPGVSFTHYRVWEHATIPANVLEGFGGLAVLASQPKAGVVDNGEFAVGIVWQAMMPGLVVCA